ncbi:TonB-dependent receptor domain-containing protein [Frateuria sp. YIM B11624]|uniref:TonB-dependent receptor domain-containing protein n=1 Tax=Frateuria sp. YIM B11624 TaxID=3143185 RepID=UPI003C75E7EA
MNTTMRFKKRLLASLIAGSAVALAAAPDLLWAQTANATLRGSGPANTQVTARNVATGSVRRTRTGADGSYAMPGLQPGTYQVDAGPGTERTVTLTVASTATLDLQQPAAPSNAPSAANATTLTGVTVSATTLVEVKTSEVGNVVSQRQIATIPQVTRNFLEFADIVPGMAFSTQNGKTSIKAGSQPSSNVNVYIDGVGQKNYIHGGGLAGQAGPNHDGDAGNPFPQLAIGEYRVITSNYKAEYDQISSAAITAETKSGTNEFHGEAFETFTSDRFRAETPAEADSHNKARGVSREYGGAFGGPIIKDKLHFFVTYEAKEFSTPTTTTGSAGTYNGVPFNNFLPPDVRSQLGPSALPFKENLYFGKIDWEPTDRDRFELSTKIRKETQIFGADIDTAPSANYNYRNDDKRVDARWQHSADAWFNELMWTYESTLDSPSAITDAPATTYFWNATDPVGQVLLINGQDPRQYFEARQKGNGIQDNLTFNDLEWHGDHVVKMGVKYKKVTLSDRDSSTAANYFYDVGPNGAASIPYRVTFGKVNSGLPLTAVSENKQFGAYIQDDWEVNDKLTLNLGVRWDYEKSPQFLNYRTLQPIVDAIYAPTYQVNDGTGEVTIDHSYADSLAAGGVNIADYISNGHNRKAPRNEIQPRFGFSYDLNADEQHVIFGGAGRAYDRNLFDVISLENSKNALSEPDIYFENPAGLNGCGPGQADNQSCFVWDPKYFDAANLQGLGSGVSEVDMINNNIKAPYSDQFSLGMRNKLGDWNTSVTLARIIQYDGIIGQLGNRYPNGHFYTYGTNTNQWGDSGVPGIGSLILFDNGKTNYNTQLLVSAEKPYTRESGWGLTISYTHTHATQNRLYSDGYAFDLPSIKDYPFQTSSAAPKHRLVVSGSVDVPWGITLAGKLTLATPTPNNSICGVPPEAQGTNYCGAQPIGPQGEYANAWPATATPSGGGRFLIGGPIFGYRDIDLQATKNFELGHGLVLQLRFDALNVLNFKNYSDVIDVFNNGVYQPYYNPIGNIYGVPRTYKLTADIKF